ncbi:MAG TPA: single-stranded-DNA-specific exonuclease RecJ [Terriglobales bacterium]
MNPAERFQTALGLSPLFARLLAARGWSETAALTEFLYPRLEHIHSPWLMLGMGAAVDRILNGIAQGESIRILGDYDADGTLATVILRQALQTLGARVSFHLPKRLDEGYGLHLAAIDAAIADGVTLAVTVDTGIREHAALEHASARSLDVIVTDHHLPPATLPPALAILNPHQPGCSYPDKGLCGSGVAFKLAHALLDRAGKLANPNNSPWPPMLQSYLKLVAIASVADSVPLLGENRVFTRFGLQGLAQPVNPGLRALLASALPKADRPVSSSDIGFRIAPRINAAGRMGAADQIVDLFFASAAEAPARAQALDALNLTRQQLCEKIQSEIAARCARDGNLLAPSLLLLSGDGWHRGVIGIVASRVLSQTQKPVIIVALEDGLAHGSGRSPANFHLLDAIATCADLFDRFGGHAQAVGFQLRAERLPELQDRLSKLSVAAANAEASDAFEVRLAELTWPFARELQRLEPCGEGNREPIFRTRGATLVSPPQVLKERHLKFNLAQDGARQTALFWNAPQPFPSLAAGATLDIEFRLEASSHPQYGDRLQLILSNFVARPASSKAAGITL